MTQKLLVKCLLGIVAFLTSCLVAGATWFGQTLWSKVETLGTRLVAVERVVIEVQKTVEKQSKTDVRVVEVLESLVNKRNVE